jgi:hypothetical protein
MSKFRVIINGVSFYTSEKAIKEARIGDNSTINQAVKCLYGNLFNASGIGQTFYAYDGKLNRTAYAIQLTRLG